MPEMTNLVPCAVNMDLTNSTLFGKSIQNAMTWHLLPLRTGKQLLHLINNGLTAADLQDFDSLTSQLPHNCHWTPHKICQ
jgi:hypothetical protein